MRIQQLVMVSMASLCLLAGGAARMRAEPAEERVQAVEQDAEKEQEATFRYKTITTETGLHFRVPEDMPIVKRGGVVMALPFDEYVYGKLQALEGRLNSLQTAVSKLEDEIEKLKEGQMPTNASNLQSRPEVS